MAYIKKTKIWNKIKKEDVKVFWNICENNLPREIREKKLKNLEYIASGYNLVYPETNKQDGTAGIKPSQLKYMCSFMDHKNLKRFISYMNNNRVELQTALSKKIKIDYKEDYLPNINLWGLIFKHIIQADIKKEKERAFFGEKILKLEQKQELDMFFDSHGKDGLKFSDEVYEAYLERTLSQEKLSEYLLLAKEFNSIQNSEISLKDIEPFKILEEKGITWKKLYGFVPKSKEMYKIKPEHWNQKLFFNSMHYFFGVRQLHKIENSNHVKNFIHIYKIFGDNLEIVRNIIKEKKFIENCDCSELEELPELYALSEGEDLAFRKVITLSRKGITIDFTLKNLVTILATIILQPSLNNFILRRDGLTYESLREHILSQESDVLEAGRTGDYNFLRSLNFEHKQLFLKYNVDRTNIPYILSLFERTKELKTSLPLSKGEIGGFTYEMLDKNDIRGLVAGYATNCCQKVDTEKRSKNPSGSACVYYGAEEETSSFFIVSKGKNIVAQSWTWVKDGVLCFDSIEFLGNSISHKILDCYEEYAEFALSKDKTLERIVSGNCSDRYFSEMYGVTSENVVHSYSYDSVRTQYLILEK